MVGVHFTLRGNKCFQFVVLELHFSFILYPSFILLYLSLAPLAGVKNENRKLEASLTSCFRIAQPDMNKLMSILLRNNNTSRTYMSYCHVVFGCHGNSQVHLLLTVGVRTMMCIKCTGCFLGTLTNYWILFLGSKQEIILIKIVRKYSPLFWSYREGRFF